MTLLSERNVGIFFVGAGIVMLALTIAGLYSLEYQGSICLIGGAILWHHSLQTDRAAQKVTLSLAALAGHESEIDALLAQGVSLDAIAADLHARYGVPPEAMLVVLTMRLRTRLDGDQEDARQAAGRIVASQRGHAVPTPEEVLDRLHVPGVGVHRDDTAIGRAYPPGLAAGMVGTLVLTPHYLFFLPMTWEEAGRKEFSTGVLAIDALSMAADAFSVVREGYRSPFSAADARKLRARFTRDGSFALPLGRIRTVRLTTAFSPTLCLEIEWEDDQGRLHRRWIDTRLREQSTPEEPQPETWARRWVNRFRLLCLAEGNDIPEPARSTRFGLIRGPGHNLSDIAPLTQTESQRRRKMAGLAFVVLAGCWIVAFLMLENSNRWGLAVFFTGIILAFIVGVYGMKESQASRRRIRKFLVVAAATLAVLSARGVQMVDSGNNWGIGLFILGVAVSCYIAFLGFRRVARQDAARRPTLQVLLETPGGLARLADDTSVDACPERTRMLAAEMLLQKAHSGDPAERQWADRAAASQAGGQLAAPIDALRTFSRNGLVFPAEVAVSKQRTTPIAGAMLTGAQYIFFLAGATAPAASGFSSLTPAEGARLETALSHGDSLAIPARTVREIELIDDEGPAIRVTTQDALTPILEFRVGDDQRPERAAATAGFWMTRMQYVAAADGNLLRWEEDRHRLTTTPYALHE